MEITRISDNTSRSVCKVWSWADYKPKVRKGEWNASPPPSLFLTPKRQLDIQRVMLVGAGTLQRQKRKRGEQSTWFWFSWRLYNGETSASSWGAQGIRSEIVTAGGVQRWASARDRNTECERGRVWITFQSFSLYKILNPTEWISF